jgi:hypothetical protein
MQHSEKGWKKKLEYFQSIELENKGSVARDHLALGTPSGHPEYRRLVNANQANPTHRANLLGMAPHIAGIRLDRYRHHAAFPTQYITGRGWRPGREPSTSGEAARCHILVNQYPDFVSGV